MKIPWDLIKDFATWATEKMFIASVIVIPFLLYRIGSKIQQQTNYLKSEEEIQQIGNNNQ